MFRIAEDMVFAEIERVQPLFRQLDEHYAERECLVVEPFSRAALTVGALAGPIRRVPDLGASWPSDDHGPEVLLDAFGPFSTRSRRSASQSSVHDVLGPSSHDAAPPSQP